MATYQQPNYNNKEKDGHLSSTFSVFVIFYQDYAVNRYEGESDVQCEIIVAYARVKAVSPHRDTIHRLFSPGGTAGIPAGTDLCVAFR